MPPRRSNRRVNGAGENETGNNNDNNPNIAEMIAQQLQAMIPTIVTQITNSLANNANGNNNNNNDGENSRNGNGCTYKAFTACNPKEFDGKGGALALTRWIEKMEQVIDISDCADDQKVKYATSSLTNKALTWWNTQIQARGRTAAMGMTWEDLKELMIEEFCPKNDMQRLENEFWNHSMSGANHAAYTDRFHELAKLVPHLVTPESKRIDRYIYGLVPEIRALVKATEPSTIQSAILKAGSLTDEMVRIGKLTKSDPKKDGGNQKQHGSDGSKRLRTASGFVAVNSERNGYMGSAPKCDKCSYHHHERTPCRYCTNCNRAGHLTKDCQVGTRDARPITTANQGLNWGTCFECGSTDHYRNACPRLNRAHRTKGNQTGQLLAIQGNPNTENQRNQNRGRAFYVGAQEALQDPNTVTGTLI